MLSFPLIHTLTGCLLDIEARADLLGWGRPPLLLFAQDRPDPSAPHQRRQMRLIHLPVDVERMGHYRAGLADFLQDLATMLDTTHHAPLPSSLRSLTACVDVNIITRLITDSTPGFRTLAWAVCYEDVLIDSEDLHEIRRVDADDRAYQVTRLRDEPHPVVFIDEQSDHVGEQTMRLGLDALMRATTLLG